MQFLNFISRPLCTPLHRRLQNTNFVTCLWDSNKPKVVLNKNSIIIVFKLTSSVTVVDFDSCDHILITEVNIPPGAIGRVTLVRVRAVTCIPTVVSYPTHCSVWPSIKVHTWVLLCWLPKGNISSCNRWALYLHIII